MSPKPRNAVPVQEPEGFEIGEARDLSPHRASAVLFLGPPGTGKSHAMASMCEEGKTLLIATLPREATSEGYQRYNPDLLLLEDKGWRPSQGRFNATAFQQFLDVMDTLAEDDEYRVILIDNGTELGEFAWHEALKPFGVGSPGDMDDRDNRFRPYTKIADYMQQAINAMLALKTAPLPKHVGVAWHLQPTKEDQVVFDRTVGQQVKKLSADTRSEGVQYEGNVLPMLQGGFRRKIAGLLDVVVYSDILYDYETDAKGKRVVGKGKQPHYMLQVRPNEERHTKLPGLLPEMAYIPNEWEALKSLLVGEE
jgi:hypothetical protein